MSFRWWPAGVALAVTLAGVGVFGPSRNAPRLLWYEGRPVKWADGRGVVLTAEGDLYAIRPGPKLERVALHAGSRTYLDAAPGPDGTVWLADGEGAIVRRAGDGTITEVGRTPFDVASLAATGRSLWAARSGVQFTYRPETDTAALALRLDDSLRIIARAGAASVPDNPFLAQLVNASQLLSLRDGGVVVAPFVRDEVIRFRPDGREMWRTARRLAQATPNPTMTIRRDSAGSPHMVVDYVPVNLGIAEGPDGTIYVLSTVAARTDSSRLDALDPATGALRRTWRFGTAQPTLEVDSRAEVRPAGITPAASAGAPERFAAFAVPAQRGDSLRFSDVQGRVVIVNFWASWCGPCKDEFPALDSLAGTYDTSRVVFVALSDDITRSGAERFLAQHPALHMRVGFGGGRLKDRYHYVGLPTTALVDTRGLAAGRWIGFAGPAQIRQLADSIAALVRRTPMTMHHHGT